MFGRGIKLFTLLGFEVRLDASWLVIAVLVTWSLASGFFPARYPEASEGVHWLMGALGALGLFASIVLHEFGHSLAARRFGVPMRGITLFIFGGIAEMRDEPPSAKAEFWVAVAGPIVSLALAALFWLAYGAAAAVGVHPMPTALLYYVGMINSALLLFNLIPAFPLDGGRVLRAFIWGWKNNLRRASEITSRIGAAFGLVLIALGVVSLIGGAAIGGIWYILLGLFLRAAAQQSYRHTVLKEALQGVSIRRFVNDRPVTVAPDTPLEQLIEDYIMRYHFKMFPVVDGDGRLLGAVHMTQVKEIPAEERAERRVGEIVTPPDETNSIDADADAVDALSIMYRASGSRLMALKDGGLAGILSLKDLQEFLNLKLELQS